MLHKMKYFEHKNNTADFFIKWYTYEARHECQIPFLVYFPVPDTHFNSQVKSDFSLF